MLLARALRPLIRTGRLTVIDADGNHHVFGTGTEPAVTVRLHDRSLHWKLAPNPGLHAGEAWMAGTLTVEEGKGLYDFLDLFGRNLGLMGLGSFKSPLRWLKPIKRRWHRLNDRVSSERNVAHHYDLSGEMYGLFLDSERQYTCAYHPTGTEDIETAQRLKERHIAAKLRLAPGMRVLDMGCGWGSLAMYLARHHDVDVTAARLRSLQLPVLEPKAFSRQVTIGGVTSEARFRTVHLDPKYFQASRFYFCEHQTPQLVWHDAYMSHPNSARSLKRLVVVADDFDAQAQSFARALGLRPDPDARIWSRSTRIDFVSRKRLNDLYRGYADPGPGGAKVAVMTISVTSLAAVKSGMEPRFAEKLIDISKSCSVLPASECFGVAIEFLITNASLS